MALLRQRFMSGIKLAIFAKIRKFLRTKRSGTGVFFENFAKSGHFMILAYKNREKLVSFSVQTLIFAPAKFMLKQA